MLGREWTLAVVLQIIEVEKQSFASDLVLCITKLRVSSSVPVVWEKEFGGLIGV